MKISPISNSLKGEHILATWPTIRPDTSDTRSYSDPNWRQRLRFWSGRALTAQALERDQRNKAGRLAWLGRALTPGIVQNLSVSLEAPAAASSPLSPQGYFLHFSQGYGITCTGEDVVVPRSLRIGLSDIPIYNPDPNDSSFPEISIIALRPAEFRRFDNENPNDPCELDHSRDAFADEQRVDAAQAVLVRIPPTALSDFDLGDPNDPRWRNRLANAFLSYESRQSKRLTSTRLESNPDNLRWQANLQSALPSIWDQAGLPIALLSSETPNDGSTRRYYLDRYSVAHRGGQSHPRSRPTIRLASEASVEALNPYGSGNPLHWRARIDQFADHLSELGAVTDISSLSQRFQYIPPAGLLPESALQILTTPEADLLNQPDRAAVSRFFPDHLAVEALPVPIEDLDGILAASAPLAPIDFSTTAPELVRILVPVSSASFDPNLLVIEQEDPIFASEIGRLVAERQDLVQRRVRIRNRYDLLRSYCYGPSTQSIDPKLARDQIEEEPIEAEASFPFGSALRSPQVVAAPAAVSIQLQAAQSINDQDSLYARIRTDSDAPPPVLELSWLVGNTSHSRLWPTPPAFPPESRDSDGEPIATPLWRTFEVSAGDLGIKSGNVSEFKLRIDSGRIALGQIGQRSDGSGQDLVWWNDQPDTLFPPAKGGTWNRVDRPALVAPFESSYEPNFKDESTLESRLDEIDTSLKLSDGAQVRQVGISKVIADLEAEIKKGDDSVDLGFLKTQANIHRIRQVILGKEAANELLTSPALSSVIDAKSARLTTEELLAAYQKLPDKEATGAPTPSGTTSPSAPTTDTNRNSSDGSGFRTFGFSTLASPELFSTSIPTVESHTSIPLERNFVKIPTDKLNLDLGKTGKTGLFNEGMLLSATAIPNKDDVLGSEPKIGESFIPRDLTFTKRFDDGATNNAYSYSKAELENTFTKLPSLKLGMEDDQETVPDVTDKDDKPITFGQLSAADSTFLGGLKFPQATTQDSSSVLSSGVKLADLNVLVLRRFEFHIARRRAILAKAKETLAAMQAQNSLMANRLAVIEGKLAEARHDLSVARVLFQEEKERVEAINKRRDQIIQDELTVLAYVRPRFLNTSVYRSNGWKAKSSDHVPAVPACLAQHGDIPPGLKSFTDLFTHSPVRWFKSLRPKLSLFDRLDQLQSLLSEANVSAIQLSREIQPKILGPALPVASQHTIQSSFTLVRGWREQVYKTPFTPTLSHGWEKLKTETEKRVSLGDLISGKHGKSKLSRQAAEELEQIESVATCLHAEFSAVSPAIRLSWVERYSQFDQAADFRDLTRLPNFQYFPRLTRQRFQSFVDWLFGRIDQSDSDAVAMINDLIRICLLLASHAPIKEIITGYVPRPTPIRPGAFIPILPFDASRVRIGMQIQVWRRSELIARGQVADLKDQEVSAKVDTVTTNGSTVVDSSMRIQFVEPELSVMSFKKF